MINEYTAGQVDTRPWGYLTVIDTGPGFCVKRIRVAPGGIHSLHRHQHRAENWVIVAGQARVTDDGKVSELVPGQTLTIKPGTVHRIANPGGSDLIFIEVQTGQEIREGDIERLEDAYGRI